MLLHKFRDYFLDQVESDKHVKTINYIGNITIKITEFEQVPTAVDASKQKLCGLWADTA